MERKKAVAVQMMYDDNTGGYGDGDNSDNDDETLLTPSLATNKHMLISVKIALGLRHPCGFCRQIKQLIFPPLIGSLAGELSYLVFFLLF